MTEVACTYENLTEHHSVIVSILPTISGLNHSLMIDSPD
jgi:hypothetical protein